MPSVISTYQGFAMSTAYKYTGDGAKVSALNNSGTGLLYIGSLVYNVVDKQVTGLESASFSGGRFLSTATGNHTLRPAYYFTDHLGSVRTVVSGGVMSQNEYYPFGKRISTGAAISYLRDRFNGKEEQWIGNDGLLDYGARIYDPEIGRWLAQDPLANLYASTSPYAYCVNNPVKYIDPDGQRTAPPPGQIGRGYGWKTNGFGGFALCENPDEQEQLSNSPAVQIITFSNFRARIDNMDDPQVGGPGGPGGGDGDDDGGEDGPIIQTVSEIGDIASIFDVIGNQLEAYAGITRLGSNGKLYFEKTPNNVFKGNQNTKTLALAKFGGKITKVAGPVGEVTTLILIGRDVNNKEYYKAGARLLYEGLTTVSLWIPGYGPIISGGLSIIGIARGEQMFNAAQSFGETYIYQYK